MAPDGYTIAADTTFKIDETGKVTSTGTVTKDGVMLVEDAKTSVKVNKVDVADGKELEGAKIEIIDKDGKVVDTWISKKDEIHEVTGLKTGETYTLHEEVAPDGYTIAADTTFKIDETGKVTSTGTVTKDGVMLVEDALAKKPEFEKKIKDTNDTTGETSKWQDSADYDIGDAVPYKLTAVLANNVSDYVKYHITFKDEMEKGLTFDKITSVKVNGTETKAYTLTQASAQKFELRLDWEAEKAAGKYTGKLPASLNGATVEVEFTATLNSDAVLGNQGNVNKAKLEYSNSPKVETDKETGEEKPSEDTEETDWDSVIAFTYVVEVNKVDESGKALAGAEFKLEKVLKDGSKAIIKTVEAKPESVFTFKGLDDGDYILTETKAPEGYKAIGEIRFTVTADHRISWNGETRTTILESLTGNVTTGALKLAADLAAGKLTGDVKNEKTSVKVSKVDVANGEELEGAKIQIIDSKGNVVEEWTSGKEAHEITGLKTGKEYTLRETVAPEGYTVTTDTTFTIDEHGKVTTTGSITEEGILLVEDARKATVAPTATPTVAQTVAPTATPVPTTNISGRKIWDDKKNLYGVRPESITVELLANGTPVEVEPDWTDKEGNIWQYTFRNVPTVTANGAEIQYTVREKPVENYETSISDYDITNKVIKKESETLITISGTKTWIDNENEAGLRPESIIVQLMAYDEEVAAVEVKADEKGNWTYTFKDVPEDDGFGHPIPYEVREKSVQGYYAQTKGYDLINVLIQPGETETTRGDTPKGDGETNRNTSTPKPNFGSKSEGELEDLFDLFDYNTPLWGMMGTGDETPVYPYVFGGAGVLAVVALLVFGKKRKKSRQ